MYLLGDLGALTGQNGVPADLLVPPDEATQYALEELQGNASVLGKPLFLPKFAVLLCSNDDITHIIELRCWANFNPCRPFSCRPFSCRPYCVYFYWLGCATHSIRTSDQKVQAMYLLGDLGSTNRAKWGISRFVTTSR